MSAADFDRPGLLFGAAYYAEYQVEGTLDRDLDLMVEAGFNLIRVGESVWSTWEPSNGVFDLDWLQPVLDGAASRGIGVILGTPTYAVPPWLQREHPEIAAVRENGRSIPWGGRQEVDYSQPAFRWYAERVIRAILERYAAHPAVIGFQVDNEPGLELFHNPSTFRRFLGWLKDRYGNVSLLNEEWGLVYWSHRITEWDELWSPEGNRQPQYQLEWRRFQSTLANELIAWQSEVVREYAGPQQFVTTCISYSRPQVSDDELVRSLDVTAGNAYYLLQDGLTLGVDLSSPTRWWHTGVPALFQWADRAFSSAQAPFLVMETNAHSVGASHQNQPGFPGQIRQAALALISRGARGLAYWNWHTIHFGTETYWSGILPHSQQPGRVFDEVAALGSSLKALEDRFDGFSPHHDAAILWSTDTKWIFEGQPPLATGSDPDPDSYTAIFNAHYRGAFDAGMQLRILHDRQFVALDPQELARQTPVLVAPAVYVADDDLLGLLREYADAGGHLVIGIRTGYADELGRARRAVAPASLTDAAGIWYSEYWNLTETTSVESSDAVALSADAGATRWLDLLHLDGAEPLVEHRHPEFGRIPVVTTHVFGAGRVTYVGTVPNSALARDVYRWIQPAPRAAGWRHSDAVSVTTGRTADGSTLAFVSNWSGGGEQVFARVRIREAETDEVFEAGDPVPIDARGARVFIVEGAE